MYSYMDLIIFIPENIEDLKAEIKLQGRPRFLSHKQRDAAESNIVESLPTVSEYSDVSL